MSAPWFKKYNDSYVKTPGQNDAGNYGVGTEAIEGAAFHVIGVHHLDQSENRGKHHIWLECLDEKGQRIQGAVFTYTWKGRTSPTQLLVPADKPPDEPAANIPMNMGQEITVWLAGQDATPAPPRSSRGRGPVSDRAFGFSTSHADEPPGNTIGHHSFYVCFQRMPNAPQPPTIPPGHTGPDIDAALIAIANAISTLERAQHALTKS